MVSPTDNDERGPGDMTRLSSCILGLALALSLAGAMAYAQDNMKYAKKNYFERDLYPMTLQYIAYDNGRISSLQSRVWGSWTVRFKRLYADAKWNPVRGTNEPGVSIEGMTCENPAVGKLDCKMGLFHIRGRNWCAISFVNNKEPFIRVKCPNYLFIYPYKNPYN
jgi:hypothetical protein